MSSIRQSLTWRFTNKAFLYLQFIPLASDEDYNPLTLHRQNWTSLSSSTTWCNKGESNPENIQWYRIGCLSTPVSKVPRVAHQKNQHSSLFDSSNNQCQEICRCSINLPLCSMAWLLYTLYGIDHYGCKLEQSPTTRFVWREDKA